MESIFVWVGVGCLILIGVIVVAKKMPRGPVLPEALRSGQPLPEFSATNEKGQTVQSNALVGRPSVILFVRGNWCPFCTKQVKLLTSQYKEITSVGARLIFVTPKPLQTTRRVAEFFEVEFEFWLDDTLSAATKLGLLLPEGVPKDHIEEYGKDTVWPTALITDSDGTIRYSKISRYIFDRPDPEVLLKHLKAI